MGESIEIAVPKVSVVIPVYNTERYVEEAIRSVMNQTLREIEIIVVNDGSTDGSWNVLSKLARQDGRIKLLSQENQGPSTTRNKGLKKALGKFIYFMDSDDLIEPDTLEYCYYQCVANNLDFVFFDADVFSDGGSMDKQIDKFDYSHKSIQPKMNYLGIDVLEKQLQGHEFRSSVCLNLISHQFLRKNKLDFYPNILHEDQLFTAQLYLYASNVLYINRCFFHRRVRPDSIMTRKFSAKNMNSYFTVSEELLKLKQQDENRSRSIIDLFIKQMLDAAVWQAHVLPLGQRLSVFFNCICRWKKYVSFRTLGVLLLKKHRYS